MHFYFFVVNPDYHHPQEDTVNFSGEYRGAVDLGCDAAFPVNTMTTKGITAFRLRLHPGEGTVIRLDKAHRLSADE
jgi:hypothetical protein